MSNPRIEPLPPPPPTPSNIRLDSVVPNATRELPSKESTDRFEKLLDRPKARDREQNDNRSLDPAQDNRRRNEQITLVKLKVEDQHGKHDHEATDGGDMGSTSDGQSGFADSGSQSFSGSMSDGSNLTFAELIKQSAQMSQAKVVHVDSQATIRNAADRTIQSLVNEVADRITIANSKAIEQEVTIQVRESLLAATEIRISQQYGQLQIQLIAGRFDSFDLLSANQAELANQLNQRLNRPVEVQLSFSGQSMNRDSQTDAEQRSGRQDDRRSSSELDAEEN